MGEAAGDKKHPKGVRSHQRMCGHEGDYGVDGVLVGLFSGQG